MESILSDERLAAQAAEAATDLIVKAGSNPLVRECPQWVENGHSPFSFQVRKLCLTLYVYYKNSTVGLR